MKSNKNFKDARFLGTDGEKPEAQKLCLGLNTTGCSSKLETLYQLLVVCYSTLHLSASKSSPLDTAIRLQHINRFN